MQIRRLTPQLIMLIGEQQCLSLLAPRIGPESPAGCSTPQFRFLEPQHVARSSSNAGPAETMNSNIRAGQQDPKQQPGGVQLDVGPSSALVDSTLGMGPSDQQNPSGRQINSDCNTAPADVTPRLGPSEQQNPSGRQSDSDCNTARVDVTLRLGSSEQSHLGGRQCDSDHNHVPSSMPIPQQQASRPQPSTPIAPQQASWPRLSMPTPRQPAPSRPPVSMPISQQQVPPQPRLMPIPRQPTPSQPPVSMPIPQQQARPQPPCYIPLPRPQVPQQPRLAMPIPRQPAPAPSRPPGSMPISQQQAPLQPPRSIPVPRPQVPQQQADQLHSSAIYLPQLQPQWQTSNLALDPQPQWPAVLLGQLGMQVQSPLLAMSPARQQQQWFGMLLPRRVLPPEWLEMLPEEMLPAGYVWTIHFLINTRNRQWLALGLPTQELWPLLLSSILPSDPQSLHLNALLIFPPGELHQQQLSRQQQTQGVDIGQGGHQAKTSLGKRKMPEGT